jgi:hypothetical protein
LRILQELTTHLAQGLLELGVVLETVEQVGGSVVFYQQRHLLEDLGAII